jgi:SEC-C motif-containing protein
MSCPCGSRLSESQCCGRFIGGECAPTAEALMRSRYTAYVRHEVDYLVETQDAESRRDLDRAAIARWSNEADWLGLTVQGVVAGGPGDETGEVEFVARFRQGGQEQSLHERSQFRKVDGRWFYVAGQVPKRAPERKEKHPGPNEPCHCGSGMKYKRCHGA